MNDPEMKLFDVHDADGRWVAGIFAQAYREVEANVKTGQFLVCSLVVASVDVSRFSVTDTGGRPVLRMGAMIL